MFLIPPLPDPALKPAGVGVIERNMQIELEVLTDHTELICSTSIERIVSGRNTALA